MDCWVEGQPTIRHPILSHERAKASDEDKDKDEDEDEDEGEEDTSNVK